jgi:type I restriction enzyme R subunit
MKDFRQGNSGVVYPDNILNNSHAQAFYGVIKETVAEYCCEIDNNMILGELAKGIDSIIDKHSKVDWRDNTEVHNRIEQEIDDLLYKYQKEYGLKLDFDEIDKIINNVKVVALRRYRI